MSGIIAQNAANATGLIKAAAGGGAWTLLTTSTASASADVSFTSKLDSTYPIYKFEFINIHPATDQVEFEFNASTDGGSSYDATKTTSLFRALHKEDDSSATLAYADGEDTAQGTGTQSLSGSIGNQNDECSSGHLFLFSPSSTTFVKHFISNTCDLNGAELCRNNYVAGYLNTTSAIDAVQFSMSSGNIDAGTIKLYGLGDS